MECANNSLLDRYRNILVQGQTMLAYASDGEWDELLALQGEYVCRVEEIAREENALVLDAQTNEVKRQLLCEILQAEDSVRELLSERLTQLSGLMTRSNTRRRVSQAYDKGVVR